EPACDYKRAFDGDRGPNTGGMGGYSPVPSFGADDVRRAVDTVLAPIVGALRDAGTPYRGCLYAGLMMGPAGVQVLEFNARFGDPRDRAYRNVARIHFDGLTYRRDLALREVETAALR